MRSLGALGNTLIVLGIGLVALFLFFVALGAFSPTETVVASVVAAIFAAAVAVHMYRVHHALSGHGGTELHRALNMQRERRGF